MHNNKRVIIIHIMYSHYATAYFLTKRVHRKLFSHMQNTMSFIITLVQQVLYLEIIFSCRLSANIFPLGLIPFLYTFSPRCKQ